MRFPLISAAFALALCDAATADPLVLHRGVAVHEWLNWAPLAADGSYIWPPYRSIAQWLAVDRPATDWAPGDQFARIRKLGFDFVRLSVDPGPLLASDGARRQQALDRLHDDVKMITAAGLKVVFNLQAVSQVAAYSMDVVNAGSSSPEIAHYQQMAADVARMLLTIGADKVAIEPFNEPSYYPCTTNDHGDWQKVMAATVNAIRAVSHEMTIVATGACGGDVIGLVDLDARTFDDPDILYSFHMYDPHKFTHQRLDDPKMFGSGLPWPPSADTPEGVVDALKARMDLAGVDPAAQATNLEVVKPLIDAYFNDNFDEAALDGEFTAAVDWAKANGIPSQRLFIGEFGVILMSDDGRTGAADADRLRYLTDVRTEAEKHGIPWSIWEYSNPYGMTVIVPKGPADPDPELLKAIGLTQ